MIHTAMYGATENAGVEKQEQTLWEAELHLWSHRDMEILAT